MKLVEAYDRIGMLPPGAYITWDLWYSYVINEYIPSQGKEEMGKFIDLGFSIYAYALWKADNR